MTDKRDLIRHKKRLSLRFGETEATRLAFTEDISSHGLFIKTASIGKLGSRLQIELTMPDGQLIQLEGMIRWAKRVPPRMIHLVKKSGMGIKILKFHSGEEHYRHMIAQFHTRTSP